MSQETATASLAQYTDERTLWDRMREHWVGYVFILPTFVMFTLLFYLPMARGVWLTFTDFELGGASPFVGLENYVWLATNDLFVYALGWTLVFAFGALALQLLVGLLSALLLNELSTRIGEWLQAVVFSPYFAAPLASGAIWMFFLNQSYGFTGRLFYAFGMDPISFLSTGFWPFVSLIVAQAWHDYAYAGIIYAAALKSIPPDQYEAAALDGAGRLKRFRDVTLPHLLTPTAIILAIRTTWNIAEFAQPYELTGGGPGTQTMLLSILTYRVAYTGYDFGRAYTIGMVMITISVVAAAIYLRTIQSEEQLYV